MANFLQRPSLRENYSLRCSMCNRELDSTDIEAYLGWKPSPKKVVCLCCLNILMEVQDIMVSA